jgi:hypothetical protein
MGKHLLWFSRIPLFLFWICTAGSMVLEGVLNEETYDQVLREGMKYSITIPRRPRDQILKVVAYDEGTNTVGSRAVSAP